jgi:molybdenum cofactor biosynthesis enzyme MoaA
MKAEKEGRGMRENGEDRQKKDFLKERLRAELDFHKQHPDLLTLIPPFPKTLMIDLTNACNHKCIFCTNRHMTRRPERIQPDLFRKVIHEARDLGVEELGLYTTGEPFMHKDLPSFVQEAKAKGFRYVYLSTNGALAAPERATAVLEAGLDSIKFSVNAGSAETYRLIHGSEDWEKVVRHVTFVSRYREEKKLKLALYLSSVLTKMTIHERESIRRAFGSFVDEIFFVDCDAQQGQMLGNEGVLYDQAPVIPFCSLPFNRLHVTCEGYLTLCCVDYQNYLAVADLNTESLAEAWKSPLFVEMRKRHLEKRLRGTLCGNCLENRGDDIHPVRPDLATAMDFPGLYRKSRTEIQNRLGETH